MVTNSYGVLFSEIQRCKVAFNLKVYVTVEVIIRIKYNVRAFRYFAKMRNNFTRKMMPYFFDNKATKFILLILTLQ